MRYSIWIVSPPNFPHSRCFDEVAIGLRAAFRALALEADIVREPSRLGDTTIVLGANLLPFVTMPSSHKRLILFNLEQIAPGSPWLSDAYISLLRRYPVWDYSARNIAELRRMGIRAQHCGIGYMPELTRITPLSECIDVLFYGAPNERRVAVLKQLEANGVRVEAAACVYGSRRDWLIAKSRIVLNMHFYESRLFEIVRVSYLLANRKCVVSEAGADTELESRFADGVAFAPYDKLVETCMQLLREPARRQALSRTGFECLAFASLPQTEYLRRVLEASEPWIGPSSAAGTVAIRNATL